MAKIKCKYIDNKKNVHIFVRIRSIEYNNNEDFVIKKDNNSKIK